jgi:hypothetical protein
MHLSGNPQLTLRIDNSWESRIKRHTAADLLIIDD